MRAEHFLYFNNSRIYGEDFAVRLFVRDGMGFLQFLIVVNPEYTHYFRSGMRPSEVDQILSEVGQLVFRGGTSWL